MISGRIADWASALRAQDLPPAVRLHLRRALLDYLGVTIAGAQHRVARGVRDHLAATARPGPAAVPGTTAALMPAAAAMANGTAAMVCELDDGHVRTAVHMGAGCLPAILACAAQDCADPCDILPAIAAAFELAARAGIALEPAAERGFHPTPLAGVLAASLGAGRALGLDRTGLVHALGMAGSFSGGLFDYHGGWLDAWCVNGGRTGHQGVTCAALAQRGIAGPADIFEGPRGLGASFAEGRLDASILRDGLGETWHLLDSYFKIHPCCRRVHAAMDAAIALREVPGFDPGQIDSILVEVSADTAQLDLRDLPAASAAQMSLPYCTALSLFRGPPEPADFEAPTRDDPALRRLVDLTRLRVADDPLLADPARLAARVTIRCAGATHSHTVTDPLGDPVNPVSDDMLAAKFHRLADPVLGPHAAARLRDAVAEATEDAPGAPSAMARLGTLCRPGQHQPTTGVCTT